MTERPPCYPGHNPVAEDDTFYEKSGTALDAAAAKGLLSPWLGLRARLFLAPISVALVSLIFVGMRLLLSSSDITHSVTSAKSRFLASCSEAEAAASLAASLPHFLATSTNAEISKSITASVRAAGKMTLLGITAIERVMSYFVDSYKSLFLCFMELLVRGSLAVVMAAVQLANEAVQAAAQTIRVAIQESVQGVNALLASAVAGVNGIIVVFGQSITTPTINVPSLSALDNIALPTVIQDGLTSLNASLPTLVELKQKMDTLIQTPFETMRVEVNETTSAFRFNDTLLNVPSMQKVAFCDNIDTSSLDHMEQDLHRITKLGVGMLIALALALVLLCVGVEWYSWKSGVRHIENTRKAYLLQRHQSSDESTIRQEKRACDRKANSPNDDILEISNLMTLLEIAKRPLLSAFAFKICRKLGIRSEPAKARTSWFLSFVSFPAAVACLLAGIVGLLSVYGQRYAINRVSSHYEHELSSSLQDLSSSVADLVNSQMRNASVEFATSTNAVILGIEEDLNTHLFGWVNTTTSTMNDTLNEFLDGITGTLSTTFGKTPFQAPLQTFVDCIVGQKIKGIEQALTWIHDNAHVNFTTVPDDVLMISADEQAQLVRPIQDTMLGSTSGQPGLVASVTYRYLEHLRKELVMFWALVGVYAAVFLVGLLVAIYATLYDSRREKSYGRVSPFTASSSLKPLLLSQREPYTPTEAKKAQISYPVQIIARDHGDLPRDVEAPRADGARSSWLSFLERASSSTDTATVPGRNPELEDAETRFERLFGCSPVTSPISARFANIPQPVEERTPAPSTEVPLVRATSMYAPASQSTPFPQPLTRPHPHSYLHPHRLSHQQPLASPSAFVFHAW